MPDTFDRAAPPLLVRLAVGILFLVAGLGKFLGPGPAGFMQKLLGDFKETWLPAWSLRAFGYCLPFVEVALGLFLIAGLYRRTVLVVTALLLIALAFGKMLAHDYPTVAQNFLFLLLTVWVLERVPEDRFSLDGWFRD